MVAHRGQEVVKPAGRLAWKTLATFDWSVCLGLTTGADKAATGRRESGNQQKAAARWREGGGGSKRVESSDSVHATVEGKWCNLEKREKRGCFSAEVSAVKEVEKLVEVWLVGLGGKWQMLCPPCGRQDRQYVAKPNLLQNLQLATNVSPQLYSSSVSTVIKGDQRCSLLIKRGIKCQHNKSCLSRVERIYICKHLFRNKHILWGSQSALLRDIWQFDLSPFTERWGIALRGEHPLRWRVARSVLPDRGGGKINRYLLYFISSEISCFLYPQSTLRFERWTGVCVCVCEYMCVYLYIFLLPHHLNYFQKWSIFTHFHTHSMHPSLYSQKIRLHLQLYWYFASKTFSLSLFKQTKLRGWQINTSVNVHSLALHSYLLSSSWESWDFTTGKKIMKNLQCTVEGCKASFYLRNLYWSLTYIRLDSTVFWPLKGL